MSYDYLAVASGAGMRPEEIPGLDVYAETIWTPVAMLRLREAYEKLVEEGKQGQHRKVLFLAPPNNKCSGPLYEIALMLDTWLGRKGARQNLDITWTTYENSFIQAFGPRLHDVVTGEFERRGIRGFTEFFVEKVEKDAVSYGNGVSLEYDLQVIGHQIYTKWDRRRFGALARSCSAFTCPGVSARATLSTRGCCGREWKPA